MMVLEHSGLDERTIVIAAQQGDKDAFKVLYDRYRDCVYNFIFLFDWGTVEGRGCFANRVREDF